MLKKQSSFMGVLFLKYKHYEIKTLLPKMSK